MILLFVILASILFIYVDYKQRTNIARTLLFVALFIIAIYFLYKALRIFRYGLLFALILIPIYLSLFRKKK